MTVKEMRNELKHYVNYDLDNYSDEKIIEMFNGLFQEEK